MSGKSNLVEWTKKSFEFAPKTLRVKVIGGFGRCAIKCGVSAFIALICALAYAPLCEAQNACTPVQQVTAQQTKKKPHNSNNLLTLDSAICLAKQAVVEAQAKIANQPKSCSNNSSSDCPRPTLSGAEFDFQTVTTNDVTGSFSLFVITIGGEKTNTVTNETDFVYPPPSSSNADVMTAFRARPQPDPVAALANDIVAASNSLAQNPSFYCLTQPTATIILTYAITNSGNLEFAPKFGSLWGNPFGLDIKATKTKSSTQAMKITLSAPAVLHPDCPTF
jgi:hypothetical protein